MEALNKRERQIVARVLRRPLSREGSRMRA